MIVANELDMSIAGPVTSDISTAREERCAWYVSPAIYLLFLAAVVVLQWFSGTYRSEFSSYPDEPAHYVTSLMLRDYILHFHFEHPLRFAEEYYRHYPKVAFGHWPPVFYVLQSLWMIVFSASRWSVRLEIAVTAALLAYAVFLEARRWFGAVAAVFAGLLTVMLPLMQDYSDQEMSEALLTLFCFWSVVYFARFVEEERPRDIWLFGLFVSLAILTKGSGWLLAMVPPLVLLLCRKIRLMKKPVLWAPVALVAVTCVPWQLMTMRLAERGWDGGSKPSIAYTANALAAFLGLFPRILGTTLLAFLILGIVAMVVRPAWKSKVAAGAAAQFALLIGVWVFHSVVPAGVEDRKLVLAVPAMVLFVFAGGRFLAEMPPLRRWSPNGSYLLVGGLAASVFLATTFRIPKVQQYGFTETAHYLSAHREFKGDTILVSSEAGGEGLLISELAMQEPRPDKVVIRATKALAEVAWNGLDYHANYSTPNQVLNCLRRDGVQLVVLDTYPPQNHFTHNDLLKDAVRDSGAFTLLANFSSDGAGAPGQVQVYKLQH